jgi:hypothetical protein
MPGGNHMDRLDAFEGFQPDLSLQLGTVLTSLF